MEENKYVFSFFLLLLFHIKLLSSVSRNNQVTQKENILVTLMEKSGLILQNDLKESLQLINEVMISEGEKGD